ncbi:sensor domain-containing diguanylate cyclase [Blastococcus sp. CT_GayMR19]|uniref:sensor domain-containing diguanylate cyclase n=1 Tax=Blastococcus sp. CT_GayMR19 TaxID=2559608 RepID=UPI001FD7608B|nr:sensor domain-containing diguanylate cyclase [Blastococcus sp. CT_GayMR19]
MTGQGVEAEPRETSGAVTSSLLRYVRAQGGEDAVTEVLRRADVRHDVEELENPSRWWSYETRRRLYSAATEVLADPETLFKVGCAAVTNGLAPSLILVLRAVGSPRQVYRRVPQVMAKFTTTSTMEILDVEATSATIVYRAQPGHTHSRMDCKYARGLLTTVPTLFGLPPAQIEHSHCEPEGHPDCTYHLSWQQRSWLGRRRTDRSSKDLDVASLQGQLRALQSAAAELVSSDDLETVLPRIVARAGEAVLAPAHLLAVSAPAGGPPLVHSVGLAPEDAERLAAALLAGEDLDVPAVVVDVASTRHRHGRLAAIYPPGYGVVGAERSVLAAYADHTAAALDLLIALKDAKVDADRVGAALHLAHELATAVDVATVCDVVTDALPRMVGCTSASLMLWDSASRRLRTQAAAGLDPAGTRRLLGAAFDPDDVPELAGILTDGEPRILASHGNSPAVEGLLRDLRLADAVVMPLVADGGILGVATASWEAGESPALLGDVLARLRGVADQASTALQKARLLEAVRHQASHDALTGLPNRVLFLEQLEAALARTEAGEHVAVLFCDLDGFKEVNDTVGHAAGDELLQQVAERLRASVRPDDTVGRLSGDEFAVILPGVAGDDDAAALAGRLLGCFDEPFPLEAGDVRIGSSVGVAVHAGGDVVAEQLLRTADAAMYRDKNVRRARRASEHGRGGGHGVTGPRNRSRVSTTATPMHRLHD